MRCPCASHQEIYNRRYVSRIDRGWPRWLAFAISPPGAKNYEKAKVQIAEFEQAKDEGRVVYGILGSVIVP